MTPEQRLVRRARTVRIMRPYLQRIVGSVLPPGWRLSGVKVREVGRFAFKHSLRYDLTADAPTGQSAKLIVRGNVPSSDTAAESLIADRAQRALARASFSSGTLRVPTSFGIIRPLRLHLYQDIPGVTLESLIVRRDRRAVPTAYRAGQWLAKLHRAALRVGPVRRAQEIARDARYFRDDVARAARPYLERAIRLLSVGAWARVDILRRYRRQLRTIHGDLNLDNVIAGSGDRTGFIDFGNSLVDDPLSDVGNFFAQVDLLTWQGRCQPVLASRLDRAFTAGYRPALSAVGPDTTERINIFRAWWTLQVLAYTLSIRPTVGRRIAPLALDAAETLLAKTGYRIAAPLRSVPPGQLTSALRDRATMLAYFSEHLPEFFPQASAIERLEPEHRRALSTRSFLMRFRLRLSWVSGKTGDRVVRGNRIDRDTYRIMARVYQRQNGFSSLRPLRFESRLGYVFYEELGGRSLRQISLRSPYFARLVAQAGRALARFHRLPTAGLRRLRWSAEQRFLRLLERRILQSHAPATAVVGRAGHALRQAEARHWNRLRALVHNDFQASNIIATTNIGLIDFTQSGVGHPAIDLGTFRAHLSVMLYGVLPDRAVERLRVRFTNAYFRSQSAGYRQRLSAALPVFELRALLDILATTVINLGPRDPNRRRYVRLLERRMNRLLAVADSL
ncbi:MAG: aminoglycoside phosphotransferase family protein [Candidatus Kerfeldbacteria bacterium]|nr:aminoglycoside phosphotransferase family protein [Candidatus Kerfeldbacteria bacterium]